MSSVPEVIAGVGFEAFIFGIAGVVLYRFLAGRFLVPKREIILPNQRGVVVQGDRVLRIAGPGTCWLRPKQRVVLIDVRPKPLQMAGVEVLGRDHGVVRLSISAEYKVDEPAVYYSNSANAADALFVQLRRVINVAAQQLPAATLVVSREDFTARVRRDLDDSAKRLGFSIVQLDIYEAVPLGILRVPEEQGFNFPDSGMVH